MLWRYASLLALLGCGRAEELPVPTWRDRCAEELRKAQSLASAQDPVFARGKIKKSADVGYSLTVSVETHELYEAEVALGLDQWAVRAQWTAPQALECDEEPCDRIEQHYSVREGVVAFLRSAGARRELFTRIFRPALERCLGLNAASR